MQGLGLSGIKGKLKSLRNMSAAKMRFIHAEIGEILIGNKVGRESDKEITFFDSTGLAAQDIAAAHVVLKAAKEKKLGYSTELMS